MDFRILLREYIVNCEIYLKSFIEYVNFKRAKTKQINGTEDYQKLYRH